MSDDRGGSHAEEEAEELFAAYLDRLECGAIGNLEELLAKHPGQEDALQALHRNWLIVRAALSDSAQTAGDALADDPLVRNLPDEKDGKRLGPCVLKCLLGKGGFGRVYRAHHEGFDLDVAVKCLKPDLVEEIPAILERFRREARLTLDLTSENLVRVLHVGHEHGLHYLVMEFVDGETARARVERKGPLAPAEAVTIARAAARGLAVLHDRGIVHRDVKHDNLLISARGQVKLADLGLAKSTHQELDVTATGEGLGSPHFMAPEQFSSAKRVGPECDVYSLGATLYFLLVGRPGLADSGTTPYEVARHAIEKGHPDIRGVLPQCDRRLAELISRATQIRPADRFPTATAFGQALDALPLAAVELTDVGTGTTATRSPLLVSPPAVRRRTRVRMLLHTPATLARLLNSRTRFGLAALVLLLSVVGYYLLKSTDDGQSLAQDRAADLLTRAATSEQREQFAEAIRQYQELLAIQDDPTLQAKLANAWVLYALEAKGVQNWRTAGERYLRAAEASPDGTGGVSGATSRASDMFERGARELKAAGQLAEALALARRSGKLAASERRTLFIAQIADQLRRRITAAITVVPPAGAVLRGHAAEAVITVADPSVTLVRVNGTPQEADPELGYLIPLVAEADNRCQVLLTVETDGGLRVEQKLSWNFDDQPPPLDLGQPPSGPLAAVRLSGADPPTKLLLCDLNLGSITMAQAGPAHKKQFRDTIDITGSTEPGTTITADGNRVAVDAQGVFSVPMHPKAVESSVLIEARDPVGHVIRKQLRVPPAVILAQVKLRRGPAGPAWVAADDPSLELVLVSAPPGGDPFFLGRYEITNDQYRAANRAVPERDRGGSRVWFDREAPGGAGTCHSLADFLTWFGDHPVVNVTWDEARSFCGEKGGRLPSRVEWSFAASGPDRWNFPYSRSGQGTNRKDANSSGYSYNSVTDTGRPTDEGADPELYQRFDQSMAARSKWEEDDYLLTAPSRAAFPAGPFGTHQQGGNVAEWLRDSSGESERLAAGGSFAGLIGDMRPNAVSRKPVNAREGSLGFRILIPLTVEK